MLNYNIRRLRDNEIAGADTINPIVKFLLGMKSQSECLTINPNGMGSVNFDLDAGSILRNVMEMIRANTIDFDFPFKVTISGRPPTLHISMGSVFFPNNEASVDSFTHTLTNADSGKMIYVRLNSITGGEIVLGSQVTHTLQTGNNNFRVTLPVATITLDGGEWQIFYHHLGTFSFVETPYFWIDGFDPSKNQHLVHGTLVTWPGWEDGV